MTAVLILGMHRSGTSCLAGMLIAAGAQVPGPAIRNWDNALGHHESLDLVRLNEAVLAHSGGHWHQEPSILRWTPAHAAERDRLLHASAPAPILLKDPRSLLTSAFWREASGAVHSIGIIRHPLAVARSLAAWRDLPLREGIAWWTAHNRHLMQWRDRGTPILDLDAGDFLERCGACIAAIPGLDAQNAWRKAYIPEQLHHDGTDSHGDGDLDGLTAAIALYDELGGMIANGPARHFPWQELDRFAALVTHEPEAAVALAQRLLASQADPDAVAVPLAAICARHAAHALTLRIFSEQQHTRVRLARLLCGKACLALGHGAAAVTALAEAIAASAQPDAEAVLLYPEALRQAGRHDEARQHLHAAADVTLYPHNVFARLASWAEIDGDRDQARSDLRAAIDAAPLRRRGRLRSRLARLCVAIGDHAGARAQLELAIDEDPAWTAARAQLQALSQRPVLPAAGPPASPVP